MAAPGAASSATRSTPTRPREEMQEFIASRRSLDEPPGEELKDYEEYAHLYRLAWTDPLNRWLLSTLPSAMIFDDHDIRDDWNTSQQWHREMNADAVVARADRRRAGVLLGLPAPRATSRPTSWPQDEVWQLIADHAAAGRDGRARPDRASSTRSPSGSTSSPETYRWSYARDLGESRLVVVDSRAARVLEPDRRSILDDDELAWLDGQLRGDVDHLFIGTSLPFLLAQGIHDLEAINEAMATGAWGPRVARLGREDAPGPRPRALGGVPGGLRRRCSTWWSRSPTASAGRPPRHHHVPLRRRAQLLRHRGRPPTSSGPAPAASCRRSAPRSATRCRARSASRSRCSRKGLARPLQFLVAPHHQGAQRALPLAGDRRARGSTTTSPPSRSAGRGLVLRWDAGVVEGENYDEPDLRQVARVVMLADRARPIRRRRPQGPLRVRWGVNLRVRSSRALPSVVAVTTQTPCQPGAPDDRHAHPPPPARPARPGRPGRAGRRT